MIRWGLMLAIGSLVLVGCAGGTLPQTRVRPSVTPMMVMGGALPTVAVQPTLQDPVLQGTQAAALETARVQQAQAQLTVGAATAMAQGTQVAGTSQAAASQAVATQVAWATEEMRQATGDAVRQTEVVSGVTATADAVAMQAQATRRALDMENLLATGTAAVVYAEATAVRVKGQNDENGYARLGGFFDALAFLAIAFIGSAVLIFVVMGATFAYLRLQAWWRYNSITQTRQGPVHWTRRGPQFILMAPAKSEAIVVTDMYEEIAEEHPLSGVGQSARDAAVAVGPKKVVRFDSAQENARREFLVVLARSIELLKADPRRGQYLPGRELIAGSREFDPPMAGGTWGRITSYGRLYLDKLSYKNADGYTVQGLFVEDGLTLQELYNQVRERRVKMLLTPPAPAPAEESQDEIAVLEGTG